MKRPEVFNTPFPELSMKKMLVLAAVLAFSVAAVGCGGSSSAPSKGTTTPASKM